MQIIRLEEVKQKTGLGRSQLYELTARGRFPRQVKLSERAVGWVASEVDDWLNARIADRDAAKR